MARNDRSEFDELWRAAWALRTSDVPQARAHLDKAWKVLRKHQRDSQQRSRWWDEGEVRLHRIEGVIAYLLSDYTTALRSLETSLKLAKAIGDEVHMAAALNDIGNIHRITGNYADAIRYYDETLSLKHAAGDLKGIAITIGNLGHVALAMGDTATALAHGEHKLRVAQELADDVLISNAHVSIGNVLHEIGRHNEAADSYREALAVLRRCDPPVLHTEGNALEHLALTMLKGARKKTSKLIDEAYDLLSRSLEIHRRIGNDINVGFNLKNIGSLYREKGWKGHNERTALEHFTEALEIAERLGVETLTFRVHRELSLWYADAGDYERALHHFQAFHDVERNVLTNEARQRLSVSESRRAAEAARADAALLELERDRLELENEHRRRDVASSAMRIVELNELLSGIRDIATSIDLTDSIRARRDLRRLIHTIDSEADADKHWQSFEERFRLLHSTYLTTLANRFPTLSPTELRVCTLIKMDTSNKDMARILSLEPGSVEKYRQRIRKKLQLTKDVNLGTFLQAIE